MSDVMPTEKSDLDVPAVVGIGLVGTIMFFVIVTAVQAFFFAYENRFLDERLYSQVGIEQRQNRAEQLEKLNGYRWVNESEGVVSIPIERAMALEVREALETAE